ncbi:MAG TPA: adenylate/guanylate cyclase domain-containing protein, partial [Actinomycetota bacterium]|nr:adenylate/guanylate cyclase domain-containing protein [Actinomycetota bacterium]
MADCPNCGEAYPALARFCPGCGSPLVGHCTECGAALPADARFCAQCGAPAQAEPVPEMIKLVTIMFADIVGSTAQAEKMAPEDARALIAEFFEAMSEEIRAEGGTIERLVGDAIMADFGVPIAREDDARRAVRAARRMLARLERFNAGRSDAARIEIRIGINTGEVSTGGTLGQQLMVMGDAVNVAARLQQIAQPGTIVIGDRTARAVRD